LLPPLSFKIQKYLPYAFVGGFIGLFTVGFIGAFTGAFIGLFGEHNPLPSRIVILSDVSMFACTVHGVGTKIKILVSNQPVCIFHLQ